MRKAFEAALAADYVEYDAGQAVLASAAVILSAKNGQPLDDDETEARVAWREGLAALDFAALAELGSKACLRVCGKSSELRELWEEDADLLSAWIGNVSYAVLVFSALSYFFPALFAFVASARMILCASLVGTNANAASSKDGARFQV